MYAIQVKAIVLIFCIDTWQNFFANIWRCKIILIKGGLYKRWWSKTVSLNGWSKNCRTRTLWVTTRSNTVSPCWWISVLEPEVRLHLIVLVQFELTFEFFTGKLRCGGFPSKILGVLADLLGHDNHDIRPYINGTLYSILCVSEVKHEAKSMVGV